MRNLKQVDSGSPPPLTGGHSSGQLGGSSGQWYVKETHQGAGGGDEVSGGCLSRPADAHHQT